MIAIGCRFATAWVTIRPVSGSATRTGVGAGVGVGAAVGVGETVGVGEVVGSPETVDEGAAVTWAPPLPEGFGLDDALPATTAPPTTTTSATAPMPSANGRFIVATISDPSLTRRGPLWRLRRAAGYRRCRRSASGASSMR